MVGRSCSSAYFSTIWPASSSAWDARGSAGQEAAPDQNLEAVADARNQAAAVVEPAQVVAQGVTQPRGQDPARAQVVAIGETARNGQDLETVKRLGCLEQAAHMPGLGTGPGKLPGSRRLLVAVRSGGTQNKHAGGGDRAHGRLNLGWANPPINE